MKVVLVADPVVCGRPVAEAAELLAAGWRSRRGDDEVVVVGASDGGAGLLDALAGPDDTWVTTEVAGPHGHPVDAALLLRADGTAVVEAARAAGAHLVPDGSPAFASATTYGVGQLLDAARDVGAARVVVGLGGVAAADGGSGALNGLGLALTVADGSGLKVGGDDLHRAAGAAPGWAQDWATVEVDLLADTGAIYGEAAEIVAGVLGLGPGQRIEAQAALDVWAAVAARDLPGEVATDRSGTASGGGLGVGLAAALPRARWRVGTEVVAELAGYAATVADAGLVIDRDRLAAAIAAAVPAVDAEEDDGRAAVLVSAAATLADELARDGSG